MRDRSTDSSNSLVPADVAEHAPPPAAPYPEFGPPAWDDGSGADGGDFSLRRVPGILFRYKWLVIGCVLLGLGAAVFAHRSTPPRYTTMILLQVADPQARSTGVTAIEAGTGFTPMSWANLLRSNSVLEEVVRDMKMYIWPMPPADRSVFDDTEIIGPLRAGQYVLAVDSAGVRVRITDRNDRIVEDRPIADELGNALGLRLNLPPAYLAPGSTLGFGVQTVRQSAMGLSGGLHVQPSMSAFMTVSMSGRNPEWIARVLNSVADNFMQEATELTRARSDELSRILEEQLATSRDALEESERRLEAFESANALRPFESGNTDASYLTLSLELDDHRRDRATLDRIIRDATSGGELQIQAMETIPAVRESSELSRVLQDLADRRAELRSLLLRWTDEHPTVVDVRNQVTQLESGTIPMLAGDLLRDLDVRIARLDAGVSSQADELRAIPTRQVTAGRLRREVSQAAVLFENVSRRHSEARLAALSATPDVQVVDWAEPPLYPERDRRSLIAMMVFAFFAGGGGIGAILLDRIDRRVRSPHDVETRLGLTILGALPHLKNKGKGRLDTREHEQAVEAFRSIRLGLLYAYGASGPTIFTVSSPSPGDGKSFTSSNLALSFAELGRRTIIVDGDIRKGIQHTLMGVDRKPGLTDFLVGEASVDQVVRSTEHPLLSVIPLGSMVSNAPDLLVSERMQELLAELKQDWDVILVDSAPLGAAADPVILGALTGSMLLVLRNGATDAEHAEAMLNNLRRYPVRLLGTVLNDVSAGGEYRYYTYSSGYGIEGNESTAIVGTTAGSREQLTPA